MATKLDLFMAEVKAYDYKWFDAIGGNDALQEIGELREQASGLTPRALDEAEVCAKNGHNLVNGVCKGCGAPSARLTSNA